jgi:hypothetical protein
MAGATANRGYPYPTDGDAQNTAVHIENLADAVDADALFLDNKINTEIDTRAAADVTLTNAVSNVIHLGEVDNHILIQAGYGEAELNEYGACVVVFPIPFAAPPIAIANNATAPNPVVIGAEGTGITSTQMVVFGTKLDGSAGYPPAGWIIAFHWIAIGFRS